MEVREGIVLIRNEANNYYKEYSISDEFEQIIAVLDFIGVLERSFIYEIKAVCTNKHYKRRHDTKYFFEGEEKELIEWAAKNQIWHWLTEVNIEK